jgi:hypothetical protein
MVTIFVSCKIFLELPTPQHIPLYADTLQMRRPEMRGKRFIEKILDTGRKVDPFVALIRESRKKSGAKPIDCRKQLYSEFTGSNSFHASYLPRPVGTSPNWFIHLPDPFCPIPFFEKSKVRNLEISRPCRRPFLKVGIFGRPILILNSRLKAYQKMVTAAGSMGSKSKRTWLHSVQPSFLLST